jgi:glycosyltransferase involved in cell wall biosynthesis
MKRPSIAFLVWRDTRHPEGGGSELYVERVAEHMAAAGWDATIVCASYAGAPAYEHRDGVTYRRGGGRLTVYLHGLAYLLGRRGRRTDVVVDVQNGVPFFSPMVRRHGVVALVHHVHREQWQIIYPGARGRIGWWLESRVAPRLYRRIPYVTVSEATKSELVALGVDRDRISIVHNGLDFPAPTRLYDRADAPTICVLGRLVPHKRVEHALDAVAALRPSIPNVRLEVIGSGWWRDHLETYARALGVSDAVTFHGGVSDAERDAILDRSWLMLVPSVKEGWGIAVMEAASRGVPAIGYRSAGGVGESIIEGETGWLAEDSDELVKRADELLTDHELRARMSEAATLHAARFDWASTGERFGAVLHGVLPELAD